MTIRKYDKPVLTIDEQITLLESRGLLIPDKNKARHYLNFISYYRLSGYTICFEEVTNGKRNHCYKKNTTFDNVLELYDFDRRLRTLVMDAIERIEVAVRTQICLVLANNYDDSHWYLKRDLFKPDFKYYSLLSQCEMEQQRSKEPFAQHYKNNYDCPILLPGWMMTELLSMGIWSKMYEHLASRQDKKNIADNFCLPQIEFQSWLHSLTYLRNLCAHHSRLWNRQFTITPRQHRDHKKQFAASTTFATQAAMIHLLLKVISPESEWTTRLCILLETHIFINPVKMGFAADWEKDSFWNVDAKGALMGHSKKTNNKNRQQISTDETA